MYLLGQVSDLDLHRLRQLADGEVPHAARHHVAVQRAPALLLLQTTNTKHSASCSPLHVSLGWSCEEDRTHLEQVGAAEEHEVDPGQ